MDISIEPQAHFDHLIFSLKIQADPLRQMMNAAGVNGYLGKRKFKGYDVEVWHYRQMGMWVSSSSNDAGYCLIGLPGTRSNLRWLGRLAAENKLKLHFYSCEIAFDIPFPNAEYEQLLPRLISLVSRIRVIGGHSVCCKIFAGNEFRKCHDKAVNGKTTFYFESLDKAALTAGFQNPGKHISYTTKVYLKKLGGVWNIRTEMTLIKKKVEQYFPFLPRELERLTMICTQLKFSDFWDLIHIDYDGFIEKCFALLERRKYYVETSRFNPKPRLWINKYRFMPAQNQKRKMLKIAKKFGMKSLENNIANYMHEMALLEAVSLPLSFEDMFLNKFAEDYAILKEKAKKLLAALEAEEREDFKSLCNKPVQRPRVRVRLPISSSPTSSRSTRADWQSTFIFDTSSPAAKSP